MTSNQQTVLVNESGHFTFVPAYTDVEMAIIEQASQLMQSRVVREPAISSPDQAAKYARHIIGYRETETFGLFYLNRQYKPLAFEVLFTGGVYEAYVDLKVIANRVARHLCSHVYAAHTHPSSNNEASFADDRLTETIAKCLDAFGVKLDDHIIVSNDESYYSYAEIGKL